MSQIVPENEDVLLALPLAGGASVVDVARQTGKSAKTVHRRLSDPAFLQIIADFRAEMVGAALGQMTDNLTRAARTFIDLLDAPEPHIRLRAARGLLTLGTKLHETFETDVRIQALEDELARKTAGMV